MMLIMSYNIMNIFQDRTFIILYIGIRADSAKQSTPCQGLLLYIIIEDWRSLGPVKERDKYRRVFVCVVVLVQKVKCDEIGYRLQTQSLQLFISK